MGAELFSAGVLPVRGADARRPQLHLVKTSPIPPAAPLPHVHDWRLLAVEYDDFGSVRMFECADCARVHYAPA